MGEGCCLNPHFFISLGSSQHTSKRGQICNFDRKKTNSSANSTRLMCYLTLGSKFNFLTSLIEYNCHYVIIYIFPSEGKQLSFSAIYWYIQFIVAIESQEKIAQNMRQLWKFNIHVQLFNMNLIKQQQCKCICRTSLY